MTTFLTNYFNNYNFSKHDNMLPDDGLLNWNM